MDWTAFVAFPRGNGYTVGQSSLYQVRRRANGPAVIEGVITIGLGIVVAFVLPDFPNTWRLLSPEMKAVANRRMALDAAEADVDVGGGMSQLAGLKAAMTDPKTYILALAYHGITGAAGCKSDPTECHRLIRFLGDVANSLISPKLLSYPDCQSLPQFDRLHPPSSIASALRTTLHLYRHLVALARSRI